jgi:hypothetical protein
MYNYDTILRPETLVLTALAATFTGFLLKEDRDKWHWRVYLWVVIFVNLLYGIFGPWGFSFGIVGVVLAVLLYFLKFQHHQYTLRDMFLYVLLLAAMCTQIASGIQR